MPAYLSGGGGGGGRNLSLRQMREMMDDVYASKAKHDRKANESQLPRETLAQHLSTYLNNRYGLRLLISEYSQATYDAIRDYEETDPDVATFGCIMRNEVEEGFIIVQRQLRQTVLELLRQQLRHKLPLKSDQSIAEVHRRKAEGVLTEEEWCSIVQYMYAETDAAAVIVRVRESARRYAVASAPASSHTAAGTSRAAGRGRSRTAADGPPPSRLPYVTFVQLLLEFQLHGHLQYLSPFVTLFSELDARRRGVLDEDAFRALALRLEPAMSEEELVALLEYIDPHNHQRISFSDCVCILADAFDRFRQRVTQADEAPGTQ